MRLNRDAIQRMINIPQGSGSVGIGGEGGSLAGIATEAWVEENYLSKAFFTRLFKAYGPAETEGDPDVEVEPNDLESDITSIEAMFGFWTEQYISALGQGSGGGSASNYVTTDTTQTISGKKTFTGGVILASAIRPSTNNYYDIGSTSYNFASGYITSLHSSYVTIANQISVANKLTINTTTISNQEYANLSADFFNINATNVARVSRSWTVGSDVRTKNIVSSVGADVDAIADAPVFNFIYKTDRNGIISLGTSAQYWQKVFPCGVTVFPDGYLGMDYASIALASAVMVARKVQSHEERIAALEAENARLQKEINELKAA